jgi:3,4-dihydroxy 2-butanone 4-phosphate synthase/GTP cyclohydrolase II
LLTNNPDKVSSLTEYGVPVVERVPLAVRPNDHNLGYLLTKRDRMGHQLSGLPELPQLPDLPRVGAAATSEGAKRT